MKRQHLGLYISLSLIAIISLYTSCRKINESTTLGGDLIPAVDNITTFETVLDASTKNNFFDDSTKLTILQNVALGYLNDPEFGQTTADVYFNIVPAVRGVNPFVSSDSVQAIDSVVLSLGYTAFYGDSNAVQTVQVFEIAQGSEFTDTALFRFDRPQEFTTTGGPLGSKSFSASQLNDSIRLIRRGDTTRTANVLRIPLTNSIGEYFQTFDTSQGTRGGFRNDSIFFRLFKGLAIKSQSSGNALTYFNLRDPANTKLTVYYQVKRNGKTDTASTDFVHATNGQANIIRRSVGGSPFEANIAGNNGERIYLQSSPGTGSSYASVKIAGLDTFANSIIHRAELIVPKVTGSGVNETIFSRPSSLYLDRKRSSNDSALLFTKDVFDLTGNLTPRFGGTIGSDNTYRFNITRHVQDVVTGREQNDSLRLFAPLQVTYRFAGNPQPLNIPVNFGPAYGRVIVGGGSNPDPAKRTRLRIIYSKIK
ncbi:MAG TPA: DUF4270 family protein [Flavisolibacter sp.]